MLFDLLKKWEHRTFGEEPGLPSFFFRESATRYNSCEGPHSFVNYLGNENKLKKTNSKKTITEKHCRRKLEVRKTKNMAIGKLIVRKENKQPILQKVNS